MIVPSTQVNTINTFNSIHLMKHKGKPVTLCGWFAKQTISLSVLAQNQTKGMDSRSPTRPEVGEERSWKRNPERSVGEGRHRGAVDNGQQKRPVGVR